VLKRILLVCGVLSSLLYVGIDAFAALRYGEYHSYVSQAISELGAVGAPTRELVDPLFLAYGVLLVAFGVGVWTSAGRTRALRVIGALLIGIAVVGLLTPPMYLRGTGNVSSDLPHIVLTGVIVLFILSAIGFLSMEGDGGSTRLRCSWHSSSPAPGPASRVAGLPRGSLRRGSGLQNGSTSALTCYGC
jgi:hypothetical protein